MADNYFIRKAKLEDVEDIVRLVKDLAEFENMPEGPQIGAKEFADGLSEWYDCLLLVHRPSDQSPSSVVGYAIYNFCFSTWMGRMAYVEDIYVSPEHRGHGLGHSLMLSVVKTCHEKGCKRVRWCVLGWNELAKRLYSKIKAENLSLKEQWELMHIEGEDLEKFVQQKLDIALIS